MSDQQLDAITTNSSIQSPDTIRSDQNLPNADAQTEPTSPPVSDFFRKFPVSADSPSEHRPPLLTERQLTALSLILTGHSDTHVARAIGVSPRTIYNWRIYDVDFS